MIEFKITEATPLEALAVVTAFADLILHAGDEIAAAAKTMSDARLMDKLPASATSQHAEPPAPAENPAGEKPPRTTKAHQDKPADPDPVPEAVDKPAATVDPAPAATTKPISKEDVRAAGRAAANLYGAAIVKDVLKRTGAPSMSDIPEDKRAAFIEELKKLGEKNA